MIPAKVLVVDDEVEFAEVLVKRLNIRLYSARAVFSPAEALSALRLEVPDVMIIDLHLPGMLGIVLARLVQKVDPAIVVIILSGHGSAESERWISNGDIFDFVMKPVDIQELTKKIDRAKKEHDVRRAKRESGHGKS
jgi:DNA-binding NtrC family response regulator